MAVDFSQRNHCNKKVITDDKLTPDQWRKIIKRLPTPTLYDYPCSDFARDRLWRMGLFNHKFLNGLSCHQASWLEEQGRQIKIEEDASLRNWGILFLILIGGAIYCAGIYFGFFQVE